MDVDPRIERLDREWREVNRQLEELAAGRATPENADPTAREQELLGELDRIEYETGLIQLEQRRKEETDEDR
jgi:hypothetical protein